MRFPGCRRFFLDMRCVVWRYSTGRLFVPRSMVVVMTVLEWLSCLGYSAGIKTMGMGGSGGGKNTNARVEI